MTKKTATTVLALVPLLALAACEEPVEDDTHGFVEVRLTRNGSDDDPFSGTSQVQIQMTYQDCYQQFYAANPNWTAEGEDGSIIFSGGPEGWADRLCSESVSGRAECQVTAIEQNLASAANRLSVTYDITGALESRVLLFGPLPLGDLTECDGGLVPRVRVEHATTLGLDSSGVPVWGVDQSDSPQGLAPGDAVVVRVSRTP